MKKNHRLDDRNPELPLLWEQIPETAHDPARNRKTLSPEVLEEIASPGDFPAGGAQQELFPLEIFNPEESEKAEQSVPADPVVENHEISLEIAEPVMAGGDSEDPPILEEAPAQLIKDEVDEAPEEIFSHDDSEEDAVMEEAVSDAGTAAEEALENPLEMPPAAVTADDLVPEEDAAADESVPVPAPPEEFSPEEVSTMAVGGLDNQPVLEETEEPGDDGKIFDQMNEVNEEKKSLILDSSFGSEESREEQGEEQPVEIFDIGPLSVGERLRSIRCRKDLTLLQVATALCTSQTNIEELENGHKKADHYGKILLERLCGIYEVPCEEFLQDFIRECPSDEDLEEDGEEPGGAGRPHRHEYIFGDQTLHDAAPRREKMSIPAIFLTVVIIGVLVILLGAWGRQKYQIWREEQDGRNFQLDILKLVPVRELPRTTLPVPKG